MTKLRYISDLLFLIVGFAWNPLYALSKQQLGLPSLFSDHMVLQRKTKIQVWGLSSPAKKLTVSAGWGKEETATADASGQ